MEKQVSFDDMPKAVNHLGEEIRQIKSMLAQRNELQPSTQPDIMLSVEQAAQMLRLAVPTIYSKVSRGELPVMKQGNRLYFSQSELIDYLMAGRKRSHSQIQSEAAAYCNAKKGGCDGNN